MGMRKHPVNPVEEEESSHSHNPKRWPQILFAGVLLAFFAFGIWDATQHSFLGSVFTGAVSVVMFVVSAILIWQLIVSPPSHAANFDHEFDLEHQDVKPTAGLWHYVLWVAGMVAATAVFGFLIAITGFFIAFLRVKAKASWLRTLLLTGLAIGGLCVLAWSLVLDFPAGMLQDLIELPWPLG
jgi:hypothetical protein